MPKSTPASRIIAAVRNAPGTRVKVAVSDIDGVLRGKYIHKDKFLSAVDGGFGFCDVVFGWDMMDVTYDNTTATGWHRGFPDALARLDLATYRTVPWDDDVPFFLGDFVETKQGKEVPLSICPRQVLKRVLARAAKLGFTPMCGLEFEWFNFRESPQTWADKKGVGPTPLTPGMFGYSLLRANGNREFFAALINDLAAFDIPIEGLHTETGPGVYEAAIVFSEALEAADRGLLFKTAAKEIGARFGIMPSFMAKWNPQLPGCSGHVHQSLSDGRRNVFHDAKRPYGMSRVFESYLAGQVDAADGHGADVLADDQQLQAAGRWVLGAGEAHVGHRQPDGELPGDPRLAQVDAAGDPLPRRRRQPVPRGGRGAGGRAARRREGIEAHGSTDPRHQPGGREYPPGAADADRDDAHFPPVRRRARLARRRFRRALRRHPRVGVAAVAGRGHRLGDEALLRDHLTATRQDRP